MPTVAVDLDGVLHAYHGWKGPDVMNGLNPGARDFLEALAKGGYTVVVYTSRPVEYVRPWLEEHDLADLVADVTNIKPPAVAYIDDRAIRFNGDFDQALEDLALPVWWKVTQ